MVYLSCFNISYKIIMELEYIVKKEDKDIMVKDLVKKRLKISSRLYTKISKSIYLNNNKCYTSARANVGDKIIVNLDDAYEDKDNMYNKFKVWNHNIEIIYEDEYLLCVNKEKGIPCHPSALHQEKTLYNAIINYYLNKNQIVPIHFVNRLDKDTTGVVVIAKHKYIQEILSKQMQNGTLKKKYIAVVYGKISDKEGIIEKRIRRKENSIILRETTEDKDAEYAKTGYKVLKYNKEKNYTVVEVFLYTGRTHQIRVHFASIGHPLLGDELYAKESNVDIKNIYEYIDRQALHAIEIKYNDMSKEEKCITAKMPQDIDRLTKFT